MIEAQKLYKNHINNRSTNTEYIKSLFNHLQNMLVVSNTNGTFFSQFVNILQNKHLTFSSPEFILATTIKNTTTINPNEHLSPATPSAAPNDDDLG